MSSLTFFLKWVAKNSHFLLQCKKERKSLIQQLPCKYLANPDMLTYWPHLHGTSRQDMGLIWSWKLHRFVIWGQHHKQHYPRQLNQDQTISDPYSSKQHRLMYLLREKKKKKQTLPNFQLYELSMLRGQHTCNQNTNGGICTIWIMIMIPCSNFNQTVYCPFSSIVILVSNLGKHPQQEG